MNISLRELNRENWETCIQLQPSPEQKRFVAPNVYSLAESKFYENMVPLAIYSKDEMVGFVMYGLDVDDNNYWIYRLMIDEKHQGKDYAKTALPLVLHQIKSIPGAEKVVIGYKPDNVAADSLYAALGFRKTGQMLFDEVIAELQF